MNIKYINQNIIKRILPFSKNNFHRGESYKPYFIIGSGRSGNTLLRKIINNHSKIFIPPETYVMGESIKLYKENKNMEWTNLVKLIYSQYQFHPEFDTFNLKSLNSLVQNMASLPTEKRSLAKVFDGFYSKYKEVHNIKSPIWCDKTPLNTLYIFDIIKVFPEAKFIHIMRNPYDVIPSYLNSGIYTNLKDASMRWRVSIEISQKFAKKYSNLYYEIHYENLVKNTRNEIEKLCEFMKIEFEENMLETQNNINLGDVNKHKHHENVSKKISASSIGKGLKSLNKSQINEINSVLIKSKNKYIQSIIQK